MRAFFRRSSFLAFALIFALLGNAIAVPAHAESSLDKHARKIQHKLAKHRQGSYLHLVMSDTSDVYGALGTLSDATFTFTSAETNVNATYHYYDVDSVKTDNQRIGQGAAPIHFRHILPVAITAAAIAAGAATYAAVR